MNIASASPHGLTQRHNDLTWRCQAKTRGRLALTLHGDRALLHLLEIDMTAVEVRTMIRKLREALKGVGEEE